MTLDEALKCADAASINMWSRPSETAAITLAAEVRRLQSEVTALRLYAPAQRAVAMQPPVQIAPTRWPAWWMVGIVQETDEEFAGKGRAYVEITG